MNLESRCSKTVSGKTDRRSGLVRWIPILGTDTSGFGAAQQLIEVVAPSASTRRRAGGSRVRAYRPCLQEDRDRNEVKKNFFQ